MVYRGYMRWDGVEVVNDNRTAKYVADMGLDGVSCFSECAALIDRLGEKGWLTVDASQGYVSVAADPAPWYDEHNPASSQFAGISVLDIQNLEASTRTISTTDIASGGAALSGVRRDAREFVVRALLLGSTTLGCQYGFAWLTTLLEYGDVCSVASVGESEYPFAGTYLDYSLECPTESRREWRRLLDVYSSVSPSVLSTHAVGSGPCGSAVGAGTVWWEVEFTITALNPGIWHDVIDFDRAGVGIDYAFVKDPVNGWAYYKDETSLVADDDVYQAPLVYEYSHTYAGFAAAVPRKATLPGGLAYTAPPDEVSLLVHDPDCPALPGFPAPPQESIFCGTEYTGQYESYIYAFRDEFLPHNVPIAPLFTMETGATALQHVRFRLEYGGEEQYNVEVTYVPPNALFRLDTRLRRADILLDGRWRSAGHLLYSGDPTKPFNYQELACPLGIVMYVDYPSELGNPFPAKSIDLGLAGRDA